MNRLRCLSFDLQIMITPLLFTDCDYPFVIYRLWLPLCYLQIVITPLLFTDCDYPFDIFKLFLYLHLNLLHKRNIKVENFLLNKQLSIYLPLTFHYQSIITSVVYIIVSHFVIDHLAIALYVFRFTDCDYPFGIYI